jgi:putative hemolysin
MWGVELVVMTAMILINGVFAAFEIALASVSVARLYTLARENRRGASAAMRMKQGMARSLAVVQLGMTFVAIVAAATGGAGAQKDISPALQAAGMHLGLANFLAIAFVVVPLTALTLVVGELIPKLFALRNKEWVCLQLAPSMSLFASSMWPVVWVLERSATTVANWSERRWKHKLHAFKTQADELQDLRAIATVARAARLIGSREENIILGAAQLTSRPVLEIMLAAEHISMLNANDSMANCLVAAHLDMHNRFPVTERTGDPQEIIGYVNFKDIVAQMRLSPQQNSLRGILRPIISVPDDVPISSALESLMRERSHIALVRSNGTVAGLITLEDILEELVGDIQDEYDQLPLHAVPSGTGWVAGGGIGLVRLRELTGVDLNADLPREGARNLNEWVAGHLGHPVRGGEAVERRGVRVVVRKVRRLQVLEAQVSCTAVSAQASISTIASTDPKR